MDFFKGYIQTKNKQPQEKFKNRTDFKSYEEVHELPEFAGVLATETILIDLDDSKEAECLMNIVESLQLNCRVYQTTRGKHFLFRNKSVNQCYTKVYLACGLKADIKVGFKNSIEVLKFDGKERFIEWDIEEGEYDYLPKWLFPVKGLNPEFITMESGDGRNDALFSYILTLMSNDFSVDECKECIRIINQYVLKDPLPDNELNVILRDEAFRKPIFFKKGVFQHHVFAEYLKTNYHLKRINGQLYIYLEDYYQYGDRQIEHVMDELIPNLKDTQRKETLKKLNVNLIYDEEESAANYIGFGNGIVKLNQTKKQEPVSYEMIPYSPDIVITNKIPYNFNPDAYDETVDKVLDNIACKNKEIRSILEEAIGYCFLRRNELGKAFILIGSGSNGKSTYLNMIKRLLGKQNYSSLDIKNFSEKFAPILMYGKLANIGDDISDDYIQDTSLFKKIVTGETIKAEDKGKPLFEFEPRVKLFCSANTIPRLGKGRDWEALKRRLIIIPFNAKFDGSEQGHDTYIGDKLKTESAMEYLLLLGFKGLLRILQNGGFTESEKTKQELQEYEKMNNPIIEFLQECEEEDYQIENAPTAEVYIKYSQFCDSGNYKSLSKIGFSRVICQQLNLVTKPVKLNRLTSRVYVRKDDAD